MNSRRYSRLIGVALVAVAVCSPALVVGGNTTVGNLILSPDGDFTELTVVGGGSTLCNHSTEPAKGGAPFRIVLDFCDAIHGLGQMNYGNLPKSGIAKIRTSQYATSPQNIVRVVLDMRNEATYSVVRDGVNLTVRVVDPNRATFANWTAGSKSVPAKPTEMASKPAVSKPMAKAEPVAQKNVAKKKTEIKSVKNTTVATTTKKSEVKAKPVQPKVKAKPEPEPVMVKTIPAPSPVGDAQPTVAVKPSTQKEFTLPVMPLVYSPEVLANPDKMAVTTPVAPTKRDQMVSKESMQPIGPQMNDQNSPGQLAQTKNSDGLWASMTAPEYEAKKQNTTGDQSIFANNPEPQPEEYAVATNEDVASVNEETTLIERLKDKFFGNQSQPRPYTTVGVGVPTDEVQGPPSPGSSISREELLARIRDAQERAKTDGGYYRRDGEGAGGIATRTILYYDDMGRRDPFAPLVTGQRSGFVTDELPNVETLRLVGILHDDHEALALLENLEGYGYILRVGDPVKNGSMIAIQNTRALFRVDDYGWSHTVSLQLTSRGSDPTKSLGAVQQQYPTYESEANGNDNGNSTSNQGSEGE